jgi:hypothetical protein
MLKMLLKSINRYYKLLKKVFSIIKKKMIKKLFYFDNKKFEINIKYIIHKKLINKTIK